MKRCLSLILVFALVIACAPVIPLQADAAVVVSGTYGDNLTWRLETPGVLTISGTGGMEYPYDSPWGRYGSVIKSVIIENGVTSIGSSAFYECSSLTSIEIPDSVTSIGSFAFYNCSSLTSVEIPDSVTSIDPAAFSSCSSLTSVEIGDSVTSIDFNTFSDCSSLTSIEIPDSVTIIGDEAFYNCSSLTSVEIGDSVTSIGDWAFTSCSSLTSIEIPDSVTSIGDSAFYYCSSLTSITIPDSVKIIGSSAFADCSNLESIAIPDSVTSIGEYAFSYCSSLTSVELDNGVVGIPECCFAGCSSLESMIIPDSVFMIGTNAFRYCSELTDVYYGGTYSQWNEIMIASGNDCLTNATIHTMVCQNAETGEKFESIEAALAATTSGTIKLLTNVSAGNLIVYPGVTLDLNGYTLTADLLVAMNGAIVTDGEDCTGGGLLKIDKDNLSLAQDNGGVVPVWNGVDGFVFTKVNFQQMAKSLTGGAAQYIFMTTLSNPDAVALLADGGADNAVKVKVGLTWAGGQCQQFYTYGDDLVSQVFASGGKLVFSLNITGIAGITDMVANAMLVTDSYAQAAADATKIEVVKTIDKLQYEFGHALLQDIIDG